MSMRRCRTYVSLAIIIFFSSVAFYGYYCEHLLQPRLRDTRPPKKAASDENWNFKRDARNLLMNETQCDLAFPDLFKDIDRAVASRQSNRITLKEIDETEKVRGYTRAIIYDQNLYIIDAGVDVNSRDLATLHALHRAIVTSPEPLPNTEFIVNVDDIPSSRANWAFSRQTSDENIWLMPDFGYWSWPEPKIGAYSEVQMKATHMDTKKPWTQKMNKLIWRGAMMGLKVREQLLEASAGKSWADVKILNWSAEAEKQSHDLLTMDDHCGYKYVAHTEGVSYSARLQNLQNCRSVIVAHKLKWLQHHHHLMQSSGPEQNFVEVAIDFSDLNLAMEALIADDAQAERIAESNVRIFREHYLTPAAETCYWRKLIRGWASVSFEPEFFEEVGSEQKWRGLPVESYVLERRLDWAVH